MRPFAAMEREKLLISGNRCVEKGNTSVLLMFCGKVDVIVNRVKCVVKA